ncbi:hypothetical protein L5515_015493 [Caenorhabditis briggsae]|uniref:Uncharacterized protein n=1 Tax=Caenorhabditis briggsae TaxID=6238 RepID=A0AAE9EHG0_CAEBR|nr:hypothetical protein L5515_015493 [Caenorhabditis briggsae]
MERQPFSIAELLAGSKAQEVPAIGSAHQLAAGLLSNNVLNSCLMMSFLWNQPNGVTTDDEGSVSSSSTKPSLSSIGISPGTNDQQRTSGVPAVGSAPQALAGLPTTCYLCVGLCHISGTSQAGFLQTMRDQHALLLQHRRSPQSAFLLAPSIINVKGPVQHSTKQIKRLLLDRRNRQKAKLIPKPALLPGTAECEQRYEEALKHHQSSPVQNDIFLANLTCLSLFQPLVPSRSMPQEVPFKACTDMDLFCAWRREKCATSSKNAKLEWKCLAEDARSMWKKKEEMVFEEFMVQVKAGFIRFQRTSRPRKFTDPIMNLPTDPKSFEEAATRIRIGCSIVQQGFAEVCRGRPDLEHQLRAAVGVIMKIVNGECLILINRNISIKFAEAQELEDTPVDPEMPMLQKEEHEEEEKETDGNAEERKQEQLCHEDAVALPKSAESQKSYPKISQPIDPSTVELFTDSEEDEAGPSTTLAPTTSKRPAPCQWRESSEERNSDEEKTSDYEEEVNKQKIKRARRCKNPKREMEIVRRNRVQEKKAVVRTQTDPLVEGSQEWKEKFAEALEYHRTCCLYDDSVFGSINLLQLFRPPISGKPNGPLPQNVLPEIKTAKVLFLNWRKNTDTEKATSKALREEEWKEMSETDRNKWYKREEALFEESLVQLRKGFIRTTLLRCSSLHNFTDLGYQPKLDWHTTSFDF